MYCETLKKTTLGRPFRTKGVECWYPVKCFSMTMGVRIQLLALEHCWITLTESCLNTLSQSWSRSEWLPPVYLPEELVSITAPQQCELIEGAKMWLSSQAADFFDTGLQILFPETTCALILTVTMLRSSLSMYIRIFVYIFFPSLITEGYFLNSPRKRY
jgi:hypothetical protein